MSMHLPQPSSALAEFKATLLLSTLQPLKESESAQPRPAFIRTRQLRSWLSAEPEGPVKVKNIDRLLADAFTKRYGGKAYAPYNLDGILHSCPLVFSMLLEVDMGHLISAVIRQQILDRNLCDISGEELGHKLKRVCQADCPEDRDKRNRQYHILHDFLSHRRWAYFPHVFKFNTGLDLEPPVILPIYKKQRIDRKGGTASIHQLCIPEEHLDEPMRECLRGSSFEQEPVGTCYYLAVKTFTETANRGDLARYLFQQEYEAYMHLQKHDGMLRYLGSYSHRNSDNLVDHNILLEYGDYDLAEYFKFSPPILPRNVCNFWHDLFDVASALSGLHKFGRIHLGRQEEYWGWHADIKPDNILSVKGQLKLADPGFAGFAKLVKGQDAPRTRVIAMTSTYGPPECHSLNVETETPQAADMWSLGCVLSEAVTWLILGPPGLVEYTKVRRDAIRRANESYGQSNLDLPSTADGVGEYDYFHDGHSVLSEVRQWHQYLIANLRKSDRMSEMILQIIDGFLLQSRPQDRFSNAEGLCIELDKIRDLFPRDLHDEQSGLPPAIEKAVVEVEARLELQPKDSIWGQNDNIQSRKALKSKDYLELPRDNVAHLSNMIKHRFGGTPEADLVMTPTHEPPRLEDMTLMTSPTAVSSGDPPTMFGPLLTSPHQSLEPTPPRRRLTEGPSTHKAQTIFDVHYAKDGSKGLARFRSFADTIRGGGKKKDDLLVEHYKNRDIKFLVDNSFSMDPEWQTVRFVLEKIAKKASWIDKDGMDLEFVHHYHPPAVKLRESQLFTIIEQAMEKHKPRSDTKTDMSAKLGVMLHDWVKNPAKSMTLIVLTDGCWSGMENDRDVEEKIVNFDALAKQDPGGILVQRHVSIQFISFGDDQDALYRLQHLDNDLVVERKIDDIVDTVPWTGDVYKMLLGSHVPEFDLLANGSDRNDNTPSISQRQDNTWPPAQSEQSYSQQTSNRHERHLSNPGQSRNSFQSTTPRTQPRTQPSPQTQREATHRQRPSHDTGYYRYPT